MPNTTSAPMPPLHILLLDNNAAEAGQIASAPQPQGHQVTQLNSGQAALELLRQTPTDLLLMDVVLPDMEGYAAIRQIKLPEPTTVCSSRSISTYCRQKSARCNASPNCNTMLRIWR